jgi:hypothetical protein
MITYRESVGELPTGEIRGLMIVAGNCAPDAAGESNSSYGDVAP